jgi:imidazolonepropionase-like amidohydrolase
VILAAAAAACLLIHNVTVIDPATATVEVRDVRIDGDHIARIGGVRRDMECPNTIVGTGKFLIPGLMDLHAHLFAHPWDEQGHLRARYDRVSIEQMLRMMLRFGVTTIRDPGAETEAAVTLREMVNSGKVRGPTIVTCGRILNQSDFDPEPFTPVHNADEMRREIQWQKDAGVDCVKIYASVRPELAKVAIDEAHRLGLPIIGHLQRTTWTEAANLGIDGVEHPAPWSRDADLFGRVTWLERLDLRGAEVEEMVAALARHHVVVDPTLIAMATKFDPAKWSRSADIALAPELYRRGWSAGAFTRDWTAEQFAAAQRAWPKLLALTRRIHDGGVTLTVGTDTPTPWIVPGASVHDEMLLLRDAGLSPMEVLRAATSNAALALHRSDIGAIRLGARADLVLLDKNPLEDLRNTRSIALVIHNGLAYDPAQQ